jgi:hypothetical protein
VVLIFYVAVNLGARVVRKRLADRRVARHLESAVAVGDSDAGAADAGGGGGGVGKVEASADLVFGPDGLLRSRGLAGTGEDVGWMGGAEGDKGKTAQEKGGAEGGDGATATSDAPDPVAGLVGRIARIHRLQLEQMESLTEQVPPFASLFSTSSPLPGGPALGSQSGPARQIECRGEARHKPRGRGACSRPGLCARGRHRGMPRRAAESGAAPLLDQAPLVRSGVVQAPVATPRLDRLPMRPRPLRN